ncbi:MAG TPA: DUF892 family protein [Terriglobales bacterium]|nr:DUF892 family protein [Terriglobales bacterium]
MNTARELFVHELQDMLDAERKLVKALGEQAQESTRPDCQKAFSQHQQQTAKQAERLQEVFSILGEQPEETECKGIKGLIEEHDSFKEEEPAPDLLDMFNVGAAVKVERYEMSAYESLIRLARELGLSTKAARLLNQNLKEEQQTLKKVEMLSRKLKPENLGVEEMEPEQQGRRSGRKSARSSSRRSRRAA